MSRPFSLRQDTLREGDAGRDAQTAAAHLAAAIAVGLLFALALSMFGGPLTDEIRHIGQESILVDAF